MWLWLRPIAANLIGWDVIANSLLSPVASPGRRSHDERTACTLPEADVLIQLGAGLVRESARRTVVTARPALTGCRRRATAGRVVQKCRRSRTHAGTLVVTAKSTPPPRPGCLPPPAGAHPLLATVAPPGRGRQKPLTAAARSDGRRERLVWVRLGRVERQVHGRLGAVVPVTVRHAGREHDQRAGAAIVALALDLDAHRAAQHVEDLID